MCKSGYFDDLWLAMITILSLDLFSYQKLSLNLD